MTMMYSLRHANGKIREALPPSFAGLTAQPPGEAKPERPSWRCRACGALIIGHRTRQHVWVTLHLATTDCGRQLRELGEFQWFCFGGIEAEVLPATAHVYTFHGRCQVRAAQADGKLIVLRDYGRGGRRRAHEALGRYFPGQRGQCARRLQE